MLRFLVRRLLLLFAGPALAACTALPTQDLRTEDGPTIGGYHEFLDWNGTAVAGERATLLNVTLRIWPREHLIVFEGDGSVYERCFYITLTDQQVQEIRRNRMSVNEDRVDVRLEITDQAYGNNVCGGDGWRQVRLIDILP